MAVFVPYVVADTDDATLLERLHGWRTSFEAASDAAGAPHPVVVVEFPQTPEGGFPKWVNRTRLVNCREVRL